MPRFEVAELSRWKSGMAGAELVRKHSSLGLHKLNKWFIIEI